MSNKSMVHWLVPYGIDNYDANRNPAVDFLRLSYVEFKWLCALSSANGFGCDVGDEAFFDGQHIELKKALMRARGDDVAWKPEPVASKPLPAYVDPRGRNGQFVVAGGHPARVQALTKEQRALVERVVGFIGEKCRLGFCVLHRMA